MQPQTKQEFDELISRPISGSLKRVFFIKDNCPFVHSYMDLVGLVGSVKARRQFIFVTTHAFPLYKDVEDVTLEHKDNSGELVEFVGQSVQPLLKTYGHLYMQSDLVEKRECGNCWYLFLFCLVVFWFYMTWEDLRF